MDRVWIALPPPRPAPHLAPGLSWVGLSVAPMAMSTLLNATWKERLAGKFYSFSIHNHKRNDTPSKKIKLFHCLLCNLRSEKKNGYVTFVPILFDFLREKLYKTTISLRKQYVKYREIVFPVKCKPICHVLRPIEGFSAKNMDAAVCANPITLSPNKKRILESF